MTSDRDLEHLEAQIAAYCLGREPDVPALGAHVERLSVYRRLVRGNLAGVAFKMLARTRHRMGAARFDASFATFLDQAGPRTHFLRDVPHEFFAWGESRWRRDPEVAAFLVDLARFELTEFAVSAAADPESNVVRAASTTPIALDRGIVVHPAARLLHLAFAVHELPEDEGDRSTPTRRDVAVLVYRDGEHAIHACELDPLGATLLERLTAGDTLGVAVRLASAPRVMDDALLAEVARSLASWGAFGVLLGGRP